MVFYIYVNCFRVIMQIIEGIKKLGNADIVKGSVLTIGNFDGLHVGHQRIMQAARDIASLKNTQLIVMTFDPHPVAILHPEKAPERLACLEYKKHLFAGQGVDILLLLKDDKELMGLSAKEFVENFLVSKIAPSVVVEGDDFHFGANRSGNVNTLTFMGAENGFETVIVEPQNVKLSIGASVKVSSTIIRNLLIEGKVADAGGALGRPYKLVGEVISGRGKGRELGFPTANLSKANQLVPAEGVYAGRVQIADVKESLFCEELQDAIFSIGTTRTYGNENTLLIEAHILDKKVGDLIGHFMAMDFIDRIREQRKFDNEKQLSEQIAKDCITAQHILKNQD